MRSCRRNLSKLTQPNETPARSENCELIEFRQKSSNRAHRRLFTGQRFQSNSSRALATCAQPRAATGRRAQLKCTQDRRARPRAGSRPPHHQHFHCRRLLIIPILLTIVANLTTCLPTQSNGRHSNSDDHTPAAAAAAAHEMTIFSNLIDDNTQHHRPRPPAQPTPTMDDTNTQPAPLLAAETDGSSSTAITADDYDNMLNYPSEHRNELTKYIINEIQSQNISSRLDKPSVAMVFGLAEAYNPLVSSSPFSGAGGQLSSSFSSPDAAQSGSAAHDNNGLLGAVLNGNSTGSSLPAPPPRPYFGDVFFSFHNVYWPFHCVTCLIICTLGIFANVTNIIVLTRPNMKSAVNVILCAMAFSDLIVNVSNIPYLSHELSDSNYTYGWAIYTLFHAHTTVTAHTISIWLTCVLATWRYCVVCRSQSTNQRNWSVGLAYRVIIVVFIFVPIFCIPNYLSFAIIQETTDSNSTFHKVGFSQLADNSQFIKTFHFWIFSVLTKLVPCVLLTFFTTALIRKLLSARERRLRLASHGNNNNNTNKGHAENGLLVAQKSSIPQDDRDRKQSATNQEIGKVHLSNGLLSAPNAAKNEGAAGDELAALNTDSQKCCPTNPIEGSGELQLDKIVINSPRRDMGPPASSMSIEENDQVLLDGHGDRSRSSTTIHVVPDTRKGRRRSQQHQSRLVHSNSSSAATDVDTTQVCSDLTSSNEDNAAESQQQKQPIVLNHLIVESCGAKSGKNLKTISKTSKIFSQQNHGTNGSTLNNANCGDKWSLMPNDNGGCQRSASTGSATFLELYACTTDDNTGVRQQLIHSDQGALSNTNPQQSNNSNSIKDKRTTEPAKPAAAVDAQRVRSVGSTSLAPFQMVKLQASQRQLTQNETTTRLLIAVMIVFLICESPAGILSVLCAILGQEFFDNVYQPMGILTDLLALINSSVNFILYCFMSTQFRITFYQVVLHCPAPNVKPQQQKPQHPMATTRLQNSNGSFRQPKSTRNDY